MHDAEHIGRAMMMANGDDKWDLSPNDTKAIQHILDRMRAAEALLRDLEWYGQEIVGYDNMTASSCPWCSGLQATPMRPDFDGWTVGHAADCRLAAALRSTSASPKGEP